MLPLLLSLSANALPPYAGQAPAPVAAEEDPFVWLVSAQVVAPGAPARVELTLTVPEGHVVYQDQLEIVAVDAGPLSVSEPDWPIAEEKPDPYDPGNTRGQYSADIIAYLPVEAPADYAGGVLLKVRTRHQGCRPGLCFPPVVQEHAFLVAVRPDDSKAGSE